MKRLFALLMVVVMLFSFTSCAKWTQNGYKSQSATFIIPEQESDEPLDSSEQSSEQVEDESSGSSQTKSTVQQSSASAHVSEKSKSSNNSSKAGSSQQSASSAQSSTQSSTGSGSLDSTLINSSHDYFETKNYYDFEAYTYIDYLFHEPVRDTGKKYPLIIFLHGLGGTVDVWNLGTARELVSSLIRLENESDKYSAYTLIPQTPTAGEGWWTESQLAAFKNLIYDMIEKYNIDPKRVYITGISMGGFTTCQLVDEMPPNTFAAAVPLSGSSNMTNPAELYNTAFRIYHAANDNIVGASCSRNLYNQLIHSGHPNVDYTEFENGNHTSPLESVFIDQRYPFFDWLFAQRLP